MNRQSTNDDRWPPPVEAVAAKILKLVQAKRNNMRATLMEVESGAMLDAE